MNNKIIQFFKSNFILKQPDHGLLVLIILINITGMLNIIFTGDSALYASISKIMVERNNYLELFTINGGDWLDKPHFPFWIWALSIKIFGANAFAFKLPAILFFFMSIVYTYLFTKEWYNRPTALTAVLILSTALHVIISNNDVRAESFLIGMLIGAAYHFYRLYKKFTFIHLLLGSLISACAVMTKGLYVLIPIISAVTGHAIINRKYRELFRFRWLLCMLLIFIFILPELYCLKVQFGNHPEKMVFGQKNVSPLKFFFWDSQFGRFFNIGPIKGKGNIFFYTYNLIWAFFPWICILYLGIFRIFKGLKEYFALFAAAVMLLIFSLSKFQLPHYTNIIFPFFSILVATLLHNKDNYKLWNRIKNIPYIFGGIIIVISLLFCILFRPENQGYLIPITFLSGFTMWRINRKTYETHKAVVYNFAVIMIFTGLFLNVVFYPSLLSYQSGYKAANYVNQNDNYKGHYTAAHRVDPHLFHFYLHNKLTTKSSIYALLDEGDPDMILFTTKDYINLFESQGIDCEILGVYKYFHVTKLSTDFIHYTTRDAVTDKHYLVRIHRQ